MADVNAAESTIESSMGRFQLLPPEIREMTFQHLLDAKYTKLKRHTRDDPAYKFHVNILRVNRAIHVEAKWILYKRNTFITASHFLCPEDDLESEDVMEDDDDLGNAEELMQKLRLWVPLVTWDFTTAEGTKLHDTGTMKYSSLQIDFAYSPHTLLSASSNSKNHSNPIRTRFYVFLSADLEAYCSVLSGRMDELCGPNFNIPENRSPPFDVTIALDGNPLSSASLAMTVRRTVYKEYQLPTGGTNFPEPHCS